MKRVPTTPRLPMTEKPALWVALAGVMLFLRVPDWFVRPRLWAEDGNQFFLAAHRDGASALLLPFAGYLHLVPRLIAWLGERVDPCLIPAVYVYSSFAFTLFVVARVFSSRLDLPGKPLIALAIVAVPHTNEVYLNLADLQWIAALSLVLTLLLRDPGDALDWVGDLVVLFLAGLTGPFSVLLLPFFVFRALCRSTRASWVILLLALSTALVQGWLIYSNPLVMPPDFPRGPFELRNLAAVLSSRVLLALFGAQCWAYRVSRAFVLVAGAVGFAAIARLAFLKDGFRKERVCMLLIGLAIVVSSVARIRDDLWDYRDMINGDRYFYIPRILAIWLVSSCLLRVGKRSYPLALSAAAAGLFAVSMVPYVEAPDFTRHHVERGYFEWHIYCDRLRAGQEVEIQVSPGWKFIVPSRPLGK